MKKKQKKKQSWMKKYSPATRRRLAVWLGLLGVILLVSIIVISQSVTNVLATQKILDQKRIELKQETQRKSMLTEGLERLDDPGYIQQYARNIFRYSAENEIIIILPTENESEGTGNNDDKKTESTSTNQQS